MTPREEKLLDALAKKLARDGQSTWLSPAEIGDLLSPLRNANSASEGASISRDLANLSAAKLIVTEGSTRSRRIKLNESSEQYLRWDLSRPPELRTPVPYKKEILASYVPNQTKWLPATIRIESNALEKQRVSPENYRRVLNSLVIDLTYASSNLENVNISWLDTKALVEFGATPNGLSEKDLQIVMNHKTALQFMCEHRTDLDVCHRDICDLHSQLMLGLLADTSAIGKIRNNVVYFDGSRYQPIGNEFVLREEFDSFCEKASQIEDPHEKALFTMAFMPYLQPFQDGNKRTSRLTMNIPLVKASLAPFSFTAVNKADYMFALLAFYERGRTDFLANVYVDAYRVSAEKYNDLLKLLGDGGSLATLAISPEPSSGLAHEQRDNEADFGMAPAG